MLSRSLIALALACLSLPVLAETRTVVIQFFQFKPASVDVKPYVCAYHGNMKGVINVKP